MATPQAMWASHVELDTDKCVHCGSCARDCPVRCITMADGKPTLKIDTCIKCGHCIAVCPSGCFSMNDVPAESLPRIKPENKCTAEQVEQLIRGRRSCRNFKTGPVDKAKIEKLLDLAHYANTGGNSQLLEYTVITTPEQLKHFGQLAVDWMVAAELPFAKGMQSAWNKGIDVVFRGAPCVIVVTLTPTSSMYSALGFTDGAIALANAELAAPSLGLATCWCGFLQMAAQQHEPLKKEFNNRTVVGALMVGEPNVHYQRFVPRKPVQLSWR
eukprot:TRINITY_DN2450_c0_g1_i1.p1 TRINITY_DN2450_c0_g1~~TRINITY_DN2450_c0_g1_i1.p1  ORF type:complete len:271 (-),score=93.56 TRINITY_DN2450_c0_g1_i1:77-889(-)